MAKQTIGIGSTANDGTGDTLRDAFDKANDNFTELYTKADTVTIDTAKNQYSLSEFATLADSTVVGAYLFGGTSGSPHVVGSASAVPTTAGSSTNWGADTGYPGGIVIANCIGGYDTVVNQTGGGTIMANHSMVKHSVDGHSIIIGGSVCVNAGDRSAIIASRESECAPGTRFSTILTSDNCEIEGADYCLLVGLNSNIENFANFSFLMGNDCEVKQGHVNAFVMGTNTDSPNQSTMCIGRQIVERNDCRSWRGIDYKRLTGATGSNATLPFTGTFPAGKVTSGVMRIRVFAMADGSADANNDGDYSIANFELNVAFRWDGTAAYLATGASTSSSTMAIPQVRDDIGLSALPTFSCTTGVPRVAVSGKASTIVNFVIDFDVLSTLVS